LTESIADDEAVMTPDIESIADEVTPDRTEEELARLYTAEAADEKRPRAVAMVGDSSSSSSSSEQSPSSSATSS